MSSKLPVLKPHEVVRRLEALGFVEVRQKGAHKQFRHADGSNQLGNLAPGAYADYTGYVPVNTPDDVIDILRWQPLRLTNTAGVTTVQKFLTPQWGRVKPFALASGSVFRPVMGHLAVSTARRRHRPSTNAPLARLGNSFS